MSFTYPVFLSLQNKKCLVIGGGKVATRKILSLLKNGALVTVVAKKAASPILNLARQKKIRCSLRGFHSSDLKGAWLVIAATNDSRLNEEVARLAEKGRQWINVVDQPALCQLIYPSVIQKGDLTLAISTNGRSPALSKAIRKDLEANFIPRYDKSLRKIAQRRPEILEKVPGVERRRSLLNRMAEETLTATGS